MKEKHTFGNTKGGNSTEAMRAKRVRRLKALWHGLDKIQKNHLHHIRKDIDALKKNMGIELDENHEKVIQAAAEQ